MVHPCVTIQLKFYYNMQKLQDFIEFPKHILFFGDIACHIVVLSKAQFPISAFTLPLHYFLFYFIWPKKPKF